MFRHRSRTSPLNVSVEVFAGVGLRSFRWFTGKKQGISASLACIEAESDESAPDSIFISMGCEDFPVLSGTGNFLFGIREVLPPNREAIRAEQGIRFCGDFSGTELSLAGQIASLVDVAVLLPCPEQRDGMAI
ncbi:hypothetical protein [Aliiruegeria lutimaris]|uniref:hypothetical protein n=1 Tax=Aliiruegeria lutimaris TaxID=571298 RepID=UPI001BAECF88|nr:hypothetical protein [Aliiruegeria lutimaris]